MVWKTIRALMISFLMLFAVVPSMAFAANDTSNDTQIINSSIDVDVVVGNDSFNETETEVETGTELEVEIENESVDSQDNSSEVETETENESVVSDSELEVLSNNLGAKIRLLQLERKIEEKISQGQLIIVELNNTNDTQVDVEKLNDILAQLENLLIEIENADLNQSADVLAQEFVAIKAESIDLVKEFRETVKSLNKSEKERLRERIRSQERVSDDEYIENLKQQYNENKVREVLTRLGLENSEDLVAKVENGETTVGEAVREVVSRFGTLSEEEKVNALLKFREEKAKSKVEIKNKENELKVKAKENRLEIKAKFKEREKEIKSQLKKYKNEFDDDDQSKLEIEVEIEDGFSKIEIESQNSKMKFRTATTDREELIQIIAQRLNVEESQVESFVEFKEDLEDESENESEEEVEIEVELKKNGSEIEVEFKGEKSKFMVRTTDRNQIIQMIANRTGLSEEKVESLVEFDEDLDDDSQEDDSDDDLN